MSSQRKKAKEIKQMVDFYGVSSILFRSKSRLEAYVSPNPKDCERPLGTFLRGGTESSCKHYPYDIPEKKTWNWPENNGCADSFKIKTLKKGVIIDRFGSPYGNFVALPETTYVDRSLPYMMNTNDCKREYNQTYTNKQMNNYHQYKIMNKNGLKVKECIIAPAFDKPGGVKQGKKQYMIDEKQNILKLLESGDLCELPRINQPNNDHPYYCKNSEHLTNSNYPLFK
jgi:hypothetical protein